MEEFLLRRLDRPWAWIAVFGGAGLMGGAMAGWSGKLPGGVVGGAAITGLVVGLVGGFFGLVVWLVCWMMGGLDQPAKRPRFWAQPMRCASCDWRTDPDGPISRRDCLCPPSRCPSCQGLTVPWVPPCPNCQTPIFRGDHPVKDLLRLVRIPKSRGEALKGHYRCRACGCVFDRWGQPQETQG